MCDESMRLARQPSHCRWPQIWEGCLANPRALVSGEMRPLNLRSQLIGRCHWAIVCRCLSVLDVSVGCYCVMCRCHVSLLKDYFVDTSSIDSWLLSLFSMSARM